MSQFHIMSQFENLTIQSETANVNESGRVVIPASYRRVLGLNRGGQVIFIVRGDEVQITTRRQMLERARQRIRKYVKPGTSLAEELIAERRKAATRE
jgi:AbrB family looped-hinge helix DNA binding protein